MFLLLRTVVTALSVASLSTAVADSATPASSVSPRRRSINLSEQEIILRAKNADLPGKMRLTFEPNIPKELRKALVAELASSASSPGDMIHFAQDPDTPAACLVQYAQQETTKAVHLNVIRHPNTPEPALHLLARNKNREVAQAARSMLSRRFPATWSQIASSLPELPAQIDPPALEIQWREAVSRHETGLLRELARKIENHKLCALIEASAPTVISDHWPEGLLVLIELLTDHGDRLRAAQIIALSAREPRLLECFRAQGLQKGDLAFDALFKAMELGPNISTDC